MKNTRKQKKKKTIFIALHLVYLFTKKVFFFFRVKEALKLQHRRLPGERPEETYQELLVNKFQKIHGTPKWAEVRDEDEEDEDDDHEILKVFVTFICFFFW